VIWLEREYQFAALSSCTYDASLRKGVQQCGASSYFLADMRYDGCDMW